MYKDLMRLLIIFLMLIMSACASNPEKKITSNVPEIKFANVMWSKLALCESLAEENTRFYMEKKFPSRFEAWAGHKNESQRKALFDITLTELRKKISDNINLDIAYSSEMTRVYLWVSDEKDGLIIRLPRGSNWTYKGDPMAKYGINEWTIRDRKFTSKEYVTTDRLRPGKRMLIEKVRVTTSRDVTKKVVRVGLLFEEDDIKSANVIKIYDGGMEVFMPMSQKKLNGIIRQYKSFGRSAKVGKNKYRAIVGIELKPSACTDGNHLAFAIKKMNIYSAVSNREFLETKTSIKKKNLLYQWKSR